MLRLGDSGPESALLRSLIGIKERGAIVRQGSPPNKEGKMIGLIGDHFPEFVAIGFALFAIALVSVSILDALPRRSPH